MHTSPAHLPGSGDAGRHERGRTGAGRGAGRTRPPGRADHAAHRPRTTRTWSSSRPGVTLRHLDAGPPTPLAKSGIDAHIDEFSGRAGEAGAGSIWCTPTTGCPGSPRCRWPAPGASRTCRATTRWPRCRARRCRRASRRSRPPGWPVRRLVARESAGRRRDQRRRGRHGDLPLRRGRGQGHASSRRGSTRGCSVRWPRGRRCGRGRTRMRGRAATCCSRRGCSR